MPKRHTTLRLSPALTRKAKAYAVRENLTLTAVMERALSAYLAEKPRARTPFVLPTFGLGGPRPGVNLDDNAALRDLMDGIE